MSIPARWILAAVLILAPSGCGFAPHDDEPGSGARSGTSVLRIHLVVDVDVLGSRPPSVEVEVSRNPRPELP